MRNGSVRGNWRNYSVHRSASPSCVSSSLPVVEIFFPQVSLRFVKLPEVVGRKLGVIRSESRFYPVRCLRFWRHGRDYRFPRVCGRHSVIFSRTSTPNLMLGEFMVSSLHKLNVGSGVRESD